MNDTPIVLAAVDAQGRGLRVAFQRWGDRFAHTIAAVDSERIVPLLASLEGSDDQPWPESPPLQEVHAEERGGATRGEADRHVADRVLMAVGRAGSTHWSLSVHAETGSPPSGGTTAVDGTSLVFDVAARLREEPAQLGSGYRTMVAPTAGPADDDTIGSLELRVVGLRCRVEIDAANDLSADLETTREGLRIAAPNSGLTLPGTVRWRYRVVSFH